MTEWRNRIVGHGDEAPEQLLANPRNWRIHPKQQQDALGQALDEVGWVQSVIVNKRSGFVVDGHARVAMAISHQEPSIPVVYVDLDEREEGIVLASLDPISAMAGRDDTLFAELLADVGLEGPLAEMLAGLGGLVDDAEFPNLPDGDRGIFRTITFTITADQDEAVSDALKRAKDAGPFAETGNENQNGNALARICEAYR